MESFGIENCDLSQLNWAFLNGFTKFSDIGIGNCDNFAATFNTFPSASLTALSKLSLGKLSDMDKLVATSYRYPTVLKNGLTHLTIADVVYPSTTTDTILQNFLANWITPSSRKTLRELRLDGNSMTKVPSEISKYNNLIDVNIWNSQPWIVQSNAFNMTKNTTIDARSLSISSSKITSIQPGAFQGIRQIIRFKQFIAFIIIINQTLYILFLKGFYGNWKVYLYGNFLTQLTSCVFKPILQQMTVTNGFGFLNVDNSKMSC